MERPPTELPDTIVPFEPAAERTLEIYGVPVHLALVPGRKARSGSDRERRPPLRRSPAERILREETYWRTDTLALTPNKYPFGKNQRILWMAKPARDPDITFWRAGLAWADQTDGTVLLNNIGAAATIPRAHAHFIEEKMPFLPGLSELPLQSDIVDVPAGCEMLKKDVPFCIVGVRGDLEGKAETLIRIADSRLTATWNVIIQKDAVWIVPRGKQTPAPYFPSAVGAAEFWGRWCYVDEEPFERATGNDLEKAIEIATTQPID